LLSCVPRIEVCGARRHNTGAIGERLDCSRRFEVCGARRHNTGVIGERLDCSRRFEVCGARRHNNGAIGERLDGSRRFEVCGGRYHGAMDDRMIYALAGMLGALVVGGFVVDRMTAPRGTTGVLGAVLPTARERAAAWAQVPVLVGLEGRDLVDGRNGDSGAWEFVFADGQRPGRLARVVAGSHVLVLREVPPGSDVATGEPLEDAQFGDSAMLARRLVAFGMRPHAPATFSLVASDSGPVFLVRTTGRLAGTWTVDARTGDLLDFAGK